MQWNPYIEADVVIDTFYFICKSIGVGKDVIEYIDVIDRPLCIECNVGMGISIINI